MTTTYPKLYKKGNVWMFRYTDHHHKRRTKSTGQTTKTRALHEMKRFIDSLQYGASADDTLRAVLRLYLDPETNPRYQDAITTGAPFSLRHARNVTNSAKALFSTLDEIPGYLNKPLYAYSRRDIKDAARFLVGAYGQTQKAARCYKVLKQLFGQAADDGMIPFSPSQGLSDIKTEQVKYTLSLPPEDIRLVISHRELFSSELSRDLFIILASTGMRRAELLALTPGQIRGGALVIDRAFKDDNGKIIGKPKWEKSRIITLPDIAARALERVFERSGSIALSANRLYVYIRDIGSRAALLEGITKPEAWEKISPHVLRHSLTTMLRVSGVPDVLVAEYLSWSHQDQSILSSSDMLANYTNLYVEHLQPVADKIDSLIGEGPGGESRDQRTG